MLIGTLFPARNRAEILMRHLCSVTLWSYHFILYTQIFEKGIPDRGITLNRSNGGVTYIDGGMIIRKWAKRNLPDLEGLTDLSEMDATESYIERDSKTSLAFQGFLLYVFAVMLLL